ncbi:GroES-like zinc-binding alcohol dehydrogenase family protein [Tripterygium wilfordii]|uniref:GroES-like zinc-binding alcohol dehydrogenase family protein n=1 Tax=Tripterygium wilfordii TaxID=458696 RepID=A0A7J7DFF6_TRIWF|nr:alcohol dehydrogenase [Tripterygium wilfordii]KAF5745090.1 GroES-like zinc-binding alcohol dehydrogenase family protein [Tripterygium wilfordii]
MIRTAIAKRFLSSKPHTFSSSSSWFLTTSNRRSLHKSTQNENNSNNSSPPSASAYHVSSGGYMRGAVFWEPNKPLSIEEFHMPRPKSGEILIKTQACGVCHSDLHVLKGELPFASPCVVGHEITGEVVEHGPQTDNKTIARLPIGSRVVGAFIMPCGNCSYCSKGHDDLCEDFFAYNRAKGTLYDGETRLFLRDNGKPVFMYSMGGFAEYCVVPANALCTLPSSLPYTESAILGCAVFTAYGAMAHAAEVRAGDSVAVIGIGGVGSSCLQIARAFGASDIIAVDVQDEKLQKAKALGATHTINALQEDVIERIKEITGGFGADIAVEALGKPKTFLQCVQSVKDGGKAVMIGLSESGAVGTIDINRLVRRKIKVIGSYGGRARQDLPKLIKLAESGIFNLSDAVTRKYKFDEAAQAFDDLNKGIIINRAVVEIQ